MQDQELLTIVELAAKLKLQKSWLYSETRKKGTGTIPRLKVGKYLRFDYAEVLQWLKNRQEN